MFTGLVEATTAVHSLEPKGDQARLILTPPFQDELALGDSVAINGCCLTVVEKGQGWFAVEVSHDDDAVAVGMMMEK